MLNHVTYTGIWSEKETIVAGVFVLFLFYRKRAYVKTKQPIAEDY